MLVLAQSTLTSSNVLENGDCTLQLLSLFWVTSWFVFACGHDRMCLIIRAQRSGKPGVSVKTLPLVPSFVYISLALTIISFIICTTMSGIWSLWHWRYEAKVYAVHGTKRTARPDQFPHATPVGAPTDELVASMPVKGGVSASGGTVSINPLMMANAASSSGSPAPKQMLLVVEPLPGDPLAPPSPASR